MIPLDIPVLLPFVRIHPTRHITVDMLAHVPPPTASSLPPMCHFDMLEAFLAHHPPPTSHLHPWTTPNTSFQHIGAVFWLTIPFFLFLNLKIGPNNPQRVSSTCWGLSLSLRPQHWPQRPPMSHFDLLGAFFFPWTLTLAPTNLNESF